MNIFFPHTWQKDTMKTNPNYQDIMERNNKREIDVLKCVVRFVQHTKRFKKEKCGF